MIGELTFLDQGLTDIEVNHCIRIRFLDQIGRVFPPQDGLNGSLPEFPHEDDPAVRMAEMLQGSIGEGALTDLRCTVLPVYGRHVVLLPRAAHQGRHCRPVAALLFNLLPVRKGLELDDKRARLDVIDGHPPAGVDGNGVRISRQRPTIVDYEKGREIRHLPV